MQRTVLITGATSGFGKATAELFVSRGWRAVVTGRRQNRLDQLVEALGPEQSHACCFDIRDRKAVAAALEALPLSFSEIKVLVNNAGMARGADLTQEADFDDWEEMIDTNIKGLLYVTRQVLPGMVRRRRGQVVNIGSVASDHAYAGVNIYGSSKAFVKQFSYNLKADLRGTGIRVTNIEPGLAETEFSKVRFRGDEGQAEAVYRGARTLDPEDIAEAVYWAVDRPEHVNISRLEIIPVIQNSAPFIIDRDE